MGNMVKTEHINYKGLFYFLLMEKIGGPIFALWTTLLLCLIYVAEVNHFDGSVSLSFYLSLTFIAFVIFFAISILTIVPAYYRAKFLRQGGYCIITSEGIESICRGKHKVYQYHNLSIKTKKHKDGSVDIFIGKSFIDFLKSTGFIWNRKTWKAYKALIGLGAPLYRVTNPDDVLAFLRSHN